MLDHFTFYELYADVVCGMDAKDAGRFARIMCKYVFDDEKPDGLTDKEGFYWSNIVDVLDEVKSYEKEGRKSKRFNGMYKHFTFYDTYYKAIKLLDDRSAGVFVKAIIEYMLHNVEPEFTDKSLQGYFTLCRRKMDISKMRRRLGQSKKPNRTVAPKVTVPDIKVTDYDSFRKAHPYILLTNQGGLSMKKLHRLCARYSRCLLKGKARTK